jgi:hypothetical protein
MMALALPNLQRRQIATVMTSTVGSSPTDFDCAGIECSVGLNIDRFQRSSENSFTWH